MSRALRFIGFTRELLEKSRFRMLPVLPRTRFYRLENPTNLQNFARFKIPFSSPFLTFNHRLNTENFFKKYEKIKFDFSNKDLNFEEIMDSLKNSKAQRIEIKGNFTPEEIIQLIQALASKTNLIELNMTDVSCSARVNSSILHDLLKANKDLENFNFLTNWLEFKDDEDELKKILSKNLRIKTFGFLYDTQYCEEICERNKDYEKFLNYYSLIILYRISLRDEKFLDKLIDEDEWIFLISNLRKKVEEILFEGAVDVVQEVDFALSKFKQDRRKITKCCKFYPDVFPNIISENEIEVLQENGDVYKIYPMLDEASFHNCADALQNCLSQKINVVLRDNSFFFKVEKNGILESVIEITVNGNCEDKNNIKVFDHRIKSNHYPSIELRDVEKYLVEYIKRNGNYQKAMEQKKKLAQVNIGKRTISECISSKLGCNFNENFCDLVKALRRILPSKKRQKFDEMAINPYDLEEGNLTTEKLFPGFDDGKIRAMNRALAWEKKKTGSEKRVQSTIEAVQLMNSGASGRNC